MAMAARSPVFRFYLNFERRNENMAKNLLRRGISVLLALIMCVSVLIVGSFAAESSEEPFPEVTVSLTPGAASAKTASSTAAAASTSAIFAAAETRGFVMGSDMEQDPPCKVSHLTV